MKKIVHLIDSLGIGGAQTHLLTILKCIDREEYFHVVFSLTDNMDIAKEIESLGIKAISLNLQESLKKRRWTEVIRAVSKMLKEERPDLLETHLTWSRILGTIVSVLVGKKKIISFEQGDIYNAGFKYRIVNFLVSFFIDVIIVPSTAIKEWVSKNYGFSRSRVVVMYNSVLTDIFSPRSGSGELKRGLGISEDEVVIGSVGTLGTGINKGMNYCIEAMSILAKKYSNIRLLIVGDGELRNTLEKQAKDLGLEGAVKFLGFRRDVDLILNAIDIFVLASPFEPCGIAMIEAMATEKPVVGSASGGSLEIIEDGITGFLFTPGDSEELARIIGRLIGDEKLRNGIGVKARKRVEEKFEAKKYVRQLESVYAGLLGKA